MTDECPPEAGADGPAETHEIAVPPDADGERIDRVMANALPGRSRSFLKRLIEEGCLSDMAGRTIIEPSCRVKPGERFRLVIPAATAPEPVGEDIPLAVVFEDEHLIVIDKPAGFVVHPAPGNQNGTLVNALIAHCGDSLKGIGGVRRPGIVHRLDKDTSGLMVAAKTATVHADLTTQFQERSIERAYAAFVWGLPNPVQGEIEGNIGRSSQNRKKMAVVGSGGKVALTRYRTEAVFAAGAASLLDCRLATGRTHQIRVHLAHLGHPVIGDPVYGSGATRARRSGLSAEALTAAQSLGRQALHARLLGFIHPATGAALRFESALPAELERLKSLLSGSGNRPRR
ncbi:MAG: RluA family pseudouridine synthase [Rhodospirillaceae bacterium]